jgi:hypothetical protein
MKKLILVLLMLSVAVECRAASLVYYVNPGATDGGDGTTSALTGANAAFVSLVDAEETLDGTYQNLVSGGNTLTINCAGSTDLSCSGEYSIVNFYDWTMDATHWVKIKGDNTTGKFDDSKFHIVWTPTANDQQGIYVGSGSRVYFENVQFTITNTNRTGAIAWNIRDDAYGWSLGCIWRCTLTNTYTGNSINITGSGTGVARNSIFYETNASRDSGAIVTGGTSTVQNCTFSNSGVGVYQWGGTSTVTNCAFLNNDDDLAGGHTVTYSAGDDADFDSGTGNIGWSTESTAWNANFTDYSTHDYSVKDTSAGIYDHGTDLSGSFTTDIRGVTRSTWDIGAFEYGTAAASALSQVIMVVSE